MFSFLSKKVMLILATVFVALLIILALVAKTFLSQVGPVSLTYDGLWEDSSVLSGIIADYNRLHPNVKITYQKQNQIKYRERIYSDLQQSTGPDIVRIHSTWTPMLRNLLAPVPSNVMSMTEFKQTFYPAAARDLIYNNKIMAIPLEIDGLVMFANSDLLDKAGLTPAASWEDFGDQVQKLTVRDGSGKIKTAGTSLGTTSNVDHWQDILALMMLQNGARPENPGGDFASASQGALVFYTDFVKKLGVWDETQDGSTLAFVRGKVAYYFGPTWRYFDIMQLSNSNGLNVKVYPVPQITGESKFVTQSSYWAEGVSASSPHQKEAFEFLKYLSSKDVLTKLYQEEKKIRAFGEPYSRVDLQSSLISDPNVGPFIGRADVANSSLLSSFTWDGQSGINSVISTYYENAVNAVLQSGDSKVAIDTVVLGLQQVLGNYGLATPK